MLLMPDSDDKRQLLNHHRFVGIKTANSALNMMFAVRDLASELAKRSHRVLNPFQAPSRNRLKHILLKFILPTIFFGFASPGGVSL
jgi:hypothetical protein